MVKQIVATWHFNHRVTLKLLRVLPPACSLRRSQGAHSELANGSLHPALHKLEQEGWIKAEWRATGNDQSSEILSLDATRAKEA